MKERIGRLFKSPPILVIAVVVMMAAATLAYAHWSGTAEISGDVHTGNIGVSWWEAATDDDGNFNGWDPGDDGSPSIFDNWPGGFWPCDGNPENVSDENNCAGPLSSADPAQPYPYENMDLPVRYDKDVAICQADAQGDQLYFWVENGYPSYHCTIAGYLFGTGNVPVMTNGLDAVPSQIFKRVCTWYNENNDEPWYGPVSWYDDGMDQFYFADFIGYDDQGTMGGSMEQPWEDGQFQPDDGEFVVYQLCPEYQLTVQPLNGHWAVYDGDALVLTFGASGGSCGVQIDPFYGDWENEFPDREDKEFRVWMHIENGAEQNANYHLGVEAKFINWNEFEEFNTCLVD